ncbi:MAG: cupin [Thaumarchaeota archaeon]|nr:cupin [Nitrososphaerota archaeon]
MNKKITVSKLGPDKQLVKSKKQYFVGNAWLSDVSLKLKIKDQKVYLANFSNGGRTKVHYHQGGQILVVTAGKGMLVFYKKTSLQNNNVKIKKSFQMALEKGDVAFIPKNTLHWHGALKGNNFVHMAFNLFTNGKESKTMWYDSDFLSYATKIK